MVIIDHSHQLFMVVEVVIVVINGHIRGDKVSHYKKIVIDNSEYHNSEYTTY